MSVRDRVQDSEFLEHAARFDAAAIMTFIAVSATAWRRSPRAKATPAFEKFIVDEILVIRAGRSNSLHKPLLTTLPDKRTRHVQSSISRSALKGADGSEVETVKIGLTTLPKFLYDAYRCMSEHTAAFHKLFPILKPGQEPTIAIEDRESEVFLRLSQETVWAVQGLPWTYIEQLREAVRFAPENQHEFPEVSNLSLDEKRSRLFPRESNEMSSQIDAYMQLRDARCKELHTQP